MLRSTLLLLSALAAAPALADAPERYVVAGVPAGDVLNVRGAPSASAADIGDLDNGDAVEVLDARDGWGRIVHGGGNGWVSLHYLRRVEPQTVGASPIPTGLICAGTEPFWSLSIDGPGHVTFSEPTADAVSGTRAEVGWAGAASGRSGFPAALRARAGGADYSLLLRAAACGDGMSDREYGWAAEVLAGDRLLTGCCRLDTDD